MFKEIQSLDIRKIPEPFYSEVWKKLPINGGNVISCDLNTPFGNWLKNQGFTFDHETWGWLVVFR